MNVRKRNNNFIIGDLYSAFRTNNLGYKIIKLFHV